MKTLGLDSVFTRNILLKVFSLLQLLINGKFVDASSGKTFPTENPATKEELIQVAEGSAEDVEAAIDAARDVSIPDANATKLSLSHPPVKGNILSRSLEL